MTAKKLADALAVAIIVIMLFALFGVTGVFSELGARIEGKEEKTEISSFSADEITDLEIEVATADITITKGTSLTIESDRFGFSLKEKKGKISLEERGGIFALDKNRKVEITVPEGFYFDKAEIETGASDINGDSLKARELELDIGAGSIALDSLEVTDKAKIDCGAGELILNKGKINNLKFSLGVGSARVNSVLTSDCDFECGVGELELNLPDGKDNYSFSLETGLGPVSFDSQRIRNSAEIGTGVNKVSVEGGVGSVNITFNNN